MSKSNQFAVFNRLKSLNKHVDLMKSEDVEQFIYSMSVKNTYKNKLFEAYQRFTDANGLNYKKPKKQKCEQFVINVPTEQRIDTIIASCGWVYSTVFSLSKYGLRPDEISKLTLRNVDLENGKINVPTSKLGANRVIQLKPNVANMLREYVHRRKINELDQRLFAVTCEIKHSWRKYRARAYDKFHDAELLKIRLYDLRHWFATTMYIRTRDIFHVKYLLGHRRLENTLIYIHLAKALSDFSDDFTCSVAHDVNEAAKLIESGFDYICEFDGVRLFRKRK